MESDKELLCMIQNACSKYDEADELNVKQPSVNYQIKKLKEKGEI